MESSVVIVVGITVTLSSLLVKFQVRLTDLDRILELRVIKQTSSCAYPIIPTLKSFGFRKILGAKATEQYYHTNMNTNNM